MLSRSLGSCKKKKRTFPSPRLLRTCSAQWAYLSTCWTHLKKLFASVTLFRSLDSHTNRSLQYHLYIGLYSNQKKIVAETMWQVDNCLLCHNIFWNPWIHWTLTSSQKELHWLHCWPSMKQLQKRQATPAWISKGGHLIGFPGKKMHTHWELCELNHHVAQRFFFWTFPRRHESLCIMSVTFSLNSGWSSDRDANFPKWTTRQPVLNHSSKCINNQHYGSLDSMLLRIKSSRFGHIGTL